MRRRHYVTTDSNHNYRRYPNLVKGMTVTAPNRVWVSDITYVETEEGVGGLLCDPILHAFYVQRLGVELRFDALFLLALVVLERAQGLGREQQYGSTINAIWCQNGQYDKCDLVQNF